MSSGAVDDVTSKYNIRTYIKHMYLPISHCATFLFPHATALHSRVCTSMKQCGMVFAL